MSKAKPPAAPSDQLRAAVADCGLTVNAVAVRAGVPQSVLQRFMAGKRDLRLGTVDKLAALFGMTFTAPRKLDAD